MNEVQNVKNNYLLEFETPKIAFDIQISSNFTFFYILSQQLETDPFTFLSWVCPPLHWGRPSAIWKNMYLYVTTLHIQLTVTRIQNFKCKMFRIWILLFMYHYMLKIHKYCLPTFDKSLVELFRIRINTKNTKWTD